MEIKVVCLNLWQGGNLFPAILSFLKEQDADILMLQEVYNGTDPAFPDKFRSVEVLEDELGYPYETFAPAVCDIVEVGKVDGGNLILSKYPITATDVTFFNEPYGERDAYDMAQNHTTPRNLQHAVIEADDLTLHVFNLQGVWDLNGDNYSQQRRNMSEVIQKATAGKQNVIVAGDTNARPTNKAMLALEKHLVNVFKDQLSSTFNMRHKDDLGYATSVVDLMYISPGLKIVSKDCPDVDVSDHLPLVVTLKIPS